MILLDYLNSFKSTVLSTIDENGAPFTSYAPFIKNENKYYVYISSIAKHSRNLSQTPKVSLFFAEDEASCENIFARKRAVLQCNSNKLQRDTETFHNLIDIFEKQHGDTMKMLKKMKDFSIFEFTPFSGEAVFGFGEAYNIGGENFDCLVERNNTKGHGHK